MAFFWPDWGMIRNFIKIAFRNLTKNKAFSFIAYVESNNILGDILRSETLAEHHGNVVILHERLKGQDIPTSGDRV